MSAWHSPQSIYNLGHSAIKDLFTVPVQIQEKVDGSFFAFGLFPEIELVGKHWVENTSFWELKCRSKGAVITVDVPPAMFQLAVETVKKLQDKLHKGWQYRGEVLCKKRHNALTYDRVPKGNVILFDVLTEEETYLDYPSLCKEAERLELEVVPQLYSGMVESPQDLRKHLETTSILGGQTVEGVVIKPLVPLYDRDKKLLMGKLVSEHFREVHKLTWKEDNPTGKDIIGRIVTMYKTPARWQKALIHLREQGILEGELRDIPALMKEVPQDILKEHVEDIKQQLFKYAWPHIQREVTRGIAEWYKEKLIEMQFEKN